LVAYHLFVSQLPDAVTTRPGRVEATPWPTWPRPAVGTFLTPTAEQAERVVGLARLTEQVGLDLVTVQDHPYQSRFLDTWTLLSVIAASTTTLRVAPNVANLPLRPPAVLARSVASLDLLSGAASSSASAQARSGTRSPRSAALG
jgi:hypothetical protein